MQYKSAERGPGLMLRTLPKPIRIFLGRHCKDVTPVANDRHGDYCADCQYPIDWPRPDKPIDVK
jgi:hypothetical protein